MFEISYCVLADLKEEVRSKYKLGSNERAYKMQNNKPSLTSMCHMVLEVSHLEVSNLSKMKIEIELNYFAKF